MNELRKRSRGMGLSAGTPVRSLLPLQADGKEMTQVDSLISHEFMTIGPSVGGLVSLRVTTGRRGTGCVRVRCECVCVRAHCGRCNTSEDDSALLVRRGLLKKSRADAMWRTR